MGWVGDYNKHRMSLIELVFPTSIKENKRMLVLSVPCAMARGRGRGRGRRPQPLTVAIGSSIASSSFGRCYNNATNGTILF